MKVYKYFNSRFKTAISMGFYYINTFDKIKKADEHGLIKDSSEGIAHNLTNKDFTVTGGNPADQKNIENLKRLNINVISGTLKTNGSNINSVVPNAYMFCVTTNRNDDYWQKIPQNQGGPYNNCIEISDFETFSIQLIKALRMQCDDGEVETRPCYYENNTAVLSDGDLKLACYFRKPNAMEFKKQHEIRIVFKPHSVADLKPLSVYVKPDNSVKVIL